ncbi:MAG: DapH/DapD/GlmU-related protein [Candidatus Nitrosotenuis sp.]
MVEIPSSYKPILYIGKDVIIKTGTVLCGNGFGYHFPSMVHKEHRHGVQIHDSVHIGSNCTIDRGRYRDTIIGKNTKIDNQVHIAHNVVIGENCLIGPKACILGSVEIGNNVQIWSNATIHQGVKIADNCVIGACSYVRHDTEKGKTYYGIPAIEHNVSK